MTLANKSTDQVNHPSHYNQYLGFEVIDVCEQLTGPDGKSGYNLGNAFKYIARAGWKNPDKRIEDLEKAAFYIQREIDRLRKAEVSDGHLLRYNQEQTRLKRLEDVLYRDAITAMRNHDTGGDSLGDYVAQEEMGAELTHHCPQCKSELKKHPDPSVLICYQEHGWMKFSTDDPRGVWMPMGSLGRHLKNNPSALRCPQCNRKLMANLVCPKEHGWMKMEGSDHVWMPPSTLPVKGNPCTVEGCMNIQHKHPWMDAS